MLNIVKNPLPNLTQSLAPRFQVPSNFMSEPFDVNTFNVVEGLFVEGYGGSLEVEAGF